MRYKGVKMDIRKQVLLPLASACSLLLSCAVTEQAPQRYLNQYGAVPESAFRFIICNRAGCEETVSVRLSNEDWQGLRRILDPPAPDSRSERVRLAHAVAKLEGMVAVQADTYDDQPRNQGVFRGTSQLDCVAETTNTTIYLLLLQRQGLMHWHEVAFPKHRGFLNLEFPHNTAVLIEKGSGRKFAIDSYFHANGELPEIVPLDIWVQGYDPGTAKAGAWMGH